MTFRSAALALLVCGCVQHATPKVTVAAALPRAQAPVAVPEPEEDFGCGVYAKGGASENPEAFRACVRRAVMEEPVCEDGGSPDLATLELAVVMIDGRGGPPDIAGARSLLAACFRDVAVEEVLAHADAKEKNPQAPPFETCDQFAQTTFASLACLTEHVQNEKAWLARQRRSFGSSLERPAFDAAARAADAWAMKLGEVDYARYAGGTMRNSAAEARIFEAMKARRERLDRIRAWSPNTSTDEATTREQLGRAKRAILEDAEPEVKKALDAEEAAWLAYRDAEVALYETLHAGARTSVTNELAAARAEMLCEMGGEP